MNDDTPLRMPRMLGEIAAIKDVLEKSNKRVERIVSNDHFTITRMGDTLTVLGKGQKMTIEDFELDALIKTLTDAKKKLA